MDIYCPKCAEPWDIDSLHEVAEEVAEAVGVRPSDESYRGIFAQVRSDFARIGCRVFDIDCTQGVGTTGSEIIAEILALAGDDIDGAASDLEDARALGLF